MATDVIKFSGEEMALAIWKAQLTTRLHWLHFGPVMTAIIQRTNAGADWEESTHSLTPDNSVN